MCFLVRHRVCVYSPHCTLYLPLFSLNLEAVDSYMIVTLKILEPRIGILRTSIPWSGRIFTGILSSGRELWKKGEAAGQPRLTFQLAKDVEVHNVDSLRKGFCT